MSALKWATLLSLGLLLMAACEQKTLLKHIVSEADDKLAKEFIEDVRTGHMVEAGALMDPRLHTSQAFQGMGQIVQAFKGGELKSIELVAAKQFFRYGMDGSERHVNLEYEMELSTGWFYGNVAIGLGGEKGRVIGAQFNQTPKALSEMNSFGYVDWMDRPVTHLFFLLLCVVPPIVCMTAFIKCLRSRIKRKWLWAIFVLFGLGAINLNWTTGVYMIQPAYIVFLGSGMIKDGIAAPWIFTLSLPVGAFAFLILRGKLTKTSLPAPLSNTGDPSNQLPG